MITKKQIAFLLLSWLVILPAGYALEMQFGVWGIIPAGFLGIISGRWAYYEGED